jgi:hemerythrin
MELQTNLASNLGFPGRPADQPAGSDRSCDSRYRSIFGQLDVLIDTMRRHPGHNQRDELRGLLQGMRHHFGAENASMVVVGYPDILLHSFQHQSICVNAAVLCHRLARSQYLLPDELSELRAIWLEHIKVHDRAFEDFLTS